MSSNKREIERENRKVRNGRRLTRVLEKASSRLLLPKNGSRTPNAGFVYWSSHHVYPFHLNLGSVPRSVTSVVALVVQRNTISVRVAAIAGALAELLHLRSRTRTTGERTRAGSPCAVWLWARATRKICVAAYGCEARCERRPGCEIVVGDGL